jgi:NADP-dependent 3-hydroxy acid dehydrogenase YdfG
MATCLQRRVTSATATPSGTGEATAPDLAARGAVVALVAHRADRLAALAA